MEPKSFSATAMHVAETCMARYKAEHIERSKGFAGTAALTGTSVHGALEVYVQEVYIKKNIEPSLKFLLECFKLSYIQTFGSADTSTDDYADGVEMLKAWFKRTKFDGVDILSCEVKENFPLPTPIGEIPFNFIWDRHDQIGEQTYKVVDYKTNRWGIRPADLRKKLQARAYGLACQIKHPDAEKIWVEFDMLRHDGPVGTVFTKADNAETWRLLKGIAKRVVETPDDEVQETLNPECNFCVRRATCKALQKNIAVGGILALGRAADMVDIRTQLEFQKKAITKTIEEIDALILTEARETDVVEFETDMNRMRVTASYRRSVDAERVAHVLGPELFDKYGGKSFTIATLEKLMKGDEVTEQQKNLLGSLIFSKQGEPSVKVEAKSIFEED